jgi:hypothetical protein
MATSGLSSLGVTLWAAECTDGEKVTAKDSYKQLTRINQIGEITVDPATIDASALEDKYTKNIPGRSTISETFAITVNDTDETSTEWTAILGKKMCFVTDIPGKTMQNFVIATVPEKIPASAIDQDGLLTFVMNCTVNDFIGWDTAIEGLATAVASGK